LSFKLEGIVPDYEKLGFSRDPLAEVLNFCVPLHGEERRKNLKEFLSEMANVAVSGGPKPWYCWGDWRIGKSTLFANMAEWVNVNFFKKRVTETLARKESKFKHAIALYLILPPKPNKWMERLATDPYKGIGLELNGQNSPGEYLQHLVDFIHGEIEPSVLKRLERGQLAPEKSSIVERFLVEKGVSERTASILREISDSSNPDRLMSSIGEMPPEEFLNLFKLGNCLVLFILDQMELEGSTEDNFRFIARIVRQFDHVMPVIVDNYGMGIKTTGAKVDKAIRALQDIIAIGETHEIKWSPVDFESILGYWLGRYRLRPKKSPTDPLQKKAVDQLERLSIVEGVPRVGVFLNLVRRILRLAASSKGVTATISGDFVKKNMEELKRVQQGAVLREKERIRVRRGTSLPSEEEFKTADQV